MIASIHSATLCVSDQDQALAFYVDKLGFRKLSDDPYGEGSRWIVVAPPGKETGLALSTPGDLGLGPEAAGAYSGITLLADDFAATCSSLASS